MAHHRLCPVCHSYDHAVPGPCPYEVSKNEDLTPAESSTEQVFPVEIPAEIVEIAEDIEAAVADGELEPAEKGEILSEVGKAAKKRKKSTDEESPE